MLLEVDVWKTNIIKTLRHTGFRITKILVLRHYDVVRGENLYRGNNPNAIMVILPNYR